MTDPETLTLRTTVIGGIRYADDYAVVWRGLSIGRIMKAIGAASDKQHGPGTVTSMAGRRPPTTAAPATILTAPRPSFGRHAGHRHQSLAGLILTGQRFDLAR